MISNNATFLAAFAQSRPGFGAVMQAATAKSAAKGNYDTITTQMISKDCKIPANSVAPAPTVPP